MFNRKLRINKVYRPYPQQAQLLSYLGTGETIFLGGQKGSGKTHALLVGAVAVATQYPGIEVVLIMRHAKGWYARLTDMLPPKTIQTRWVRDLRVRLRNGSEIIFPSLLNARGLLADCVFVDNANELSMEDIHRLSNVARGGKYADIQRERYSKTISDIEEAVRYIHSEIRRKIKLFWRRLRGRIFLPTLVYAGSRGEISDEYFQENFVNESRPEGHIYISLKLKDSYIWENNPHFVQWLQDGNISEEYHEMWIKNSW